MAHPLVELCFSPSHDDSDSAWRSRDHDRAQPKRAPRAPGIAAAIRAGDELAFDELFHDLYPRLIRLAAVYVDGDTAGDVVVNVFTTLWDTRSSWHPINVESFLYRAVRNRALNHLRHITREHRRRNIYQQTRPDHIDPIALPDDDSRAAAVRLAVRELNERQREFVVLRWQEGRTPAQIADLLGTTTRAITSLQDRTLAILRRRVPEIFAQLEER